MQSPIPRYTFLGFNLLALLDLDVHLDPRMVRERLDDGSLLDWLEAEYRKPPYGFEVGETDEAGRATIIRAFQRMGDIDPGRKFGVEKNGVAMLAAYCFEILQAGAENYEWQD